MTMVALLFVGCSCGPDIVDRRTKRTKPVIDWVVVDTATITIKSSPGLYAVNPVDVNIVWTEPSRGNFEVDCGVITVDDTDPDLLAIGTCVINTIRVNNLNICGGGSDKCTVGAIRMYTVGAHEGFVNTTEGYGVPFLADGNVVGLTSSNALALDSYTIPSNDRRLRNNDFTDLSYDLTIDMGNAGIGDYEVDVTIELLLGI